MTKWAKTAAPHWSFRGIVWVIWSCIKLYVIGIHTLIKELCQKSPEKTTESLFEDGTVAIVTGGASGIGYEVTRKLAYRKIHVIIASRCEKEANMAIGRIKDEQHSSKVEFLPLDLASFNSVELFVKKFLALGLPLHILVNNAGVLMVPYKETENMLETHFQVNYLSHLYLTCLLIDKMKASGRRSRYSRIINTSSAVHCIADVGDIQPCCGRVGMYSPHAAYAASKLAIVTATYTLSKRLRGENSYVTVNSLHPGVVNSRLYKNIHWSIRWVMDILRNTLFQTTQDAAQYVIYLALSSKVEGHSGGYYDNNKMVESKSCTYSSSCQSSLSRMSCEQLDADILKQVLQCHD